MDPKISCVLQNTLANHRHELLVDNFAGLPVLQQHGGADENVPVYHSRRLHGLISTAGSSSIYEELGGKGHWFEGVMTTEPLKEFYRTLLDSGGLQPETPRSFSIVVPNAGIAGSRGGISVDQLVSPDQLGRIDVQRGEGQKPWMIKTSNIRRFQLESLTCLDELPHGFEIDGHDIVLSQRELCAGRLYFGNGLNEAWLVSRQSNYQANNP